MTEKPIHLDIPSLGPDPISLAGKDRWILGSDPERADLVLPGAEIAGVHCVLAVQGRGLLVTDLGSEAGTQIDGRPITRAKLGPGQRLDVAHVSVWISDEVLGRADALPSIAGYEVSREVGRGAGGHVYLALQTSLQRQVAIKVLAPALSHDPELVRRFESEARAAAALGHPNVVTVIDVGSQGSVHYLSMEYMAEGSLADRVEKRGPLSWRQTLRMMSDACKALAFAESRQLVHRDIKPANLMLTETGVTKLADLGLVMDLSQDHGSGPTMGTPHFLAPEVVRGETPSPRSDIYALGATAYQVSTGYTPFEGNSSKEILRAALTTEAPSPSERDPEIPEPVSALILDMMAKEPEQRPQSAQEVLERIDRLELQLGLPETESVGGGRKWMWLVAGPILVAVAFFAWRSTRPAEPGPTPSSLTNGTAGPGESAQGIDSPPTFRFQETDAATDTEGQAPDLGADFESLAQERLNALKELSLTDAERIIRLRGFAQEFRGSNSADEALTQAGTLEERIRSAERSEQRAAELLATEKQTVQSLAKWDPAQDSLVGPVQALLAYNSSLTEGAAETIDGIRKATLSELFEEANRYLQGELDGAHAQLELGEFAAAQTRLQNQIDRFQPTVDLDLSSLYVAGQAPGSVLQFRARVQELSILLAEFPQLQEQWFAKVQSEDQLTLGRQLGRNSGLWQELQALQLETVHQRLQRTIGMLRSDAGRDWASTIDRDVVRMQAYLATWRREYKAGNWKAQVTLDPRSERPNSVGVTGVDEDWISLAGERIPLGQFLGRERDFRFLFEGRLKTALNSEESEGLANLLRLRAVLSVMDQVQEMLVGSDEARFSEGEGAAVHQTLQQAQEGQTPAGLQALALEQRTAKALVAGLQAYSLRDYGTAAGYLARAFEVGRGSLLLILLSDGELLPLEAEQQKD